jgi:hypothetical protein
MEFTTVTTVDKFRLKGRVASAWLGRKAMNNKTLLAW